MDEPHSSAELPPLSRDRAFWGMTSTQFLGAFNDNLFKQLVLLLCVDYLLLQKTLQASSEVADVHQPIALALFAVPFVLFSGFAGWLSDRINKRGIFVAAKVAEIGVMALGAIAFAVGGDDLSVLLSLLFVVLFCMSTQSAFFGPAKYGILPELFRERDLPAANGIVQMTTFVAIIFGMALAGFSKDWFEGRLWIVSLMCVVIAVVGTATAFLLRKTPTAHPGLPFQPSALVLVPETRRMVFGDRALLEVLIVSSVFWFLGGAAQPAVNALGKDQLNLGDSRTSMAAACLGVGIAIGCVLAGRLSRGTIDFRLTRIGAWGAAGAMCCVVLVGATFGGAANAPGLEPFFNLFFTRYPGELPLRLVLTCLGIFAGLFVVPLQVFLQAHPPADQKGRVIGAMNLFNWIGIVLSAVFYIVADRACVWLSISPSWIFALLAAGMAAIAVLYRPTVAPPQSAD
ncbi:MAG: MFS transporter [Planctomycetaceae bacterium]